MLGVYLLGFFTIIRANFSYLDDLYRSVSGDRGWYDWSRYVSEFASIFVHADTNLTDISPLPQLLAILILSVSSVLLVYVTGNKQITIARLLASIPIGLSPYFLGCLSFKFDAPYMALSILASIIPFLFISRKKAFLFCSVVSLLIMCMTYQTASGIYLLIAILLCFQDWNRRKKSTKEILSFLGMALLAFCFAMILFKLFIMKTIDLTDYNYTTTEMHRLSTMVSGILINVKDYLMTIHSDFGMTWKIGIVLVCILFVIKSIHLSLQKKTLVFFVSILVIGSSFILSFGIYSLLTTPMLFPRSLYGFGVFLAILCIYVVSDYKKIAAITALALNYCLLTFAFSYGNALADQARYAEFRISILLHDLSSLYPDHRVSIQLENRIDYTPLVKNISKHYPVIEKLVPTRLGTGMEGRVGIDYFFCDNYYYLTYFNYYPPDVAPFEQLADLRPLDLPVVLDSYYHTIKSDGTYCLVLLKH